MLPCWEGVGEGGCDDTPARESRADAAPSAMADRVPCTDPAADRMACTLGDSATLGVVGTAWLGAARGDGVCVTDRALMAAAAHCATRPPTPTAEFSSSTKPCGYPASSAMQVAAGYAACTAASSAPSWAFQGSASPNRKVQRSCMPARAAAVAPQSRTLSISSLAMPRKLYATRPSSRERKASSPSGTSWLGCWPMATWASWRCTARGAQDSASRKVAPSVWP